MYPIISTIGTYELRSWGLVVAIGMLLAVFLSYRLAPKGGIDSEQLLDFSVYGLICGVLGTRVWEVIFSWEKYSGDWLAPFKVWEGGMSIQGGIVGGVLAVIWYVRKYKLNFWQFADVCAPGLALGQAVGRIGCLLNGCCPGVPSQSWLGVSYHTDTVAFAMFGSQRLVPAEFIEGLADFAIVAILLSLFSRRPYTGFITAVYFGLYGINRFVMEFWRADSLTVGQLPVAQITAIGMVVVSVCMLAWLNRKNNAARRENHGA